MIPLFSDHTVNGNIDFQGTIKRVLDSHWYIFGQEVSGFESEFARYIGVSDCISVANGTDAIEISLRGLGVCRGDTVVTVANAGFYSSTAIHAIGAVPIYVDVEAASLTMAPEALARALSGRPKCVIVTHLYGQLADIGALVDLARGAGVPVIEDCAQAHGATREGLRAGSWGDVACFSFYPTKNLGALGDGGAIVTDDLGIAARLRNLRQYGWAQKYQVAMQGGRNSRLDEIQAAVLREKLPFLDGWNAERRRIANHYNTAFENFPLISLPSIGDDYVAHLYVIRVQERDSFRSFLRESGVATDVHYPVPDHLQPAYSKALVVGEMSVTEAASTSVVSLPCFPGLKISEISHVIESVKDYFHR